MAKLLKQLKKQAAKNPKRIVFPEATEERILKACKIIMRKGIAKVILIGDEKKINEDTNNKFFGKEYWTGDQSNDGWSKYWDPKDSPYYPTGDSCTLIS